MNLPKRRVRFVATMAGSPSVSTRGGIDQLGARPAASPRATVPRTSLPGFESPSVASARREVPMASMRPASIAISQSNRSASSMYAVETSTLIPGRPARIWSINDPELLPRQRIDAGRRLVQDQQVGVVNQRRSRARPSASCRPRASRPGRSGKGIEARGLQQRIDVRLRVPRRPGRTVGQRNRYSRRRSARNRDSCPDLAACRRSAGRRRSRCRAAMSPPSTRTVPDCIFLPRRCSPIKVDLPTPSGPIRPTMHPDGISAVTASRRVPCRTGG